MWRRRSAIVGSRLGLRFIGGIGARPLTTTEIVHLQRLSETGRKRMERQSRRPIFGLALALLLSACAKSEALSDEYTFCSDDGEGECLHVQDWEKSRPTYPLESGHSPHKTLFMGFRIVEQSATNDGGAADLLRCTKGRCFAKEIVIYRCDGEYDYDLQIYLEDEERWVDPPIRDDASCRRFVRVP